MTEKKQKDNEQKGKRMSESTSRVEFRDSFLIHTEDEHVRTGYVSLEAPVPLSVSDFESACAAMERMKNNLQALVVCREIEKEAAQPQPVMGEALDPALITGSIPGVDLTDRRRGPRKKA